MNRTQLVEFVAEEAGLSSSQAQAAVSATLEGIVGAVADGAKVSLPGFGSFEPRERAARTGRNPATGAELNIPASIAPAFKPASAFKQAVAKS